jgi:hypothetical protein
VIEQLIRGPLVWLAFGVFFAGLLIEGWRFFRSSRRIEAISPPPEPRPAPLAEAKPAGNWLDHLNRRAAVLFERYWKRIRRSWWFTHPTMLVLTVVFHVLLFATPIFCLAHNELLRRAWGLSLPAFADGITDALTILTMFGGLLFLGRRILLRRVRAICTLGDYLALFITLAPFVTGFMAYHHLGDYRMVITIHILCGEIMLAALPFSKLGHMLYFFLYRFLLGGEYGLARRSRVW